MKEKIEQRYILSRKVFWLLGFVTFSFFVALNVFKVQDVVARMLGYQGATPMFFLDMHAGYSPALVAEVLGNYGEVGRSVYTKLLLSLDVVFPLLYGLFFFFAVRAVFERLGVSKFIMALVSVLPILVMCFDWSENISLLYLLSLYPDFSSGVAGFASFMTLLKFSFGALSVLALLVGLSLVVFQRFSKSRSI